MERVGGRVGPPFCGRQLLAEGRYRVFKGSEGLGMEGGGGGLSSWSDVASVGGNGRCGEDDAMRRHPDEGLTVVAGLAWQVVTFASLIAARRPICRASAN